MGHKVCHEPMFELSSAGVRSTVIKSAYQVLINVHCQPCAARAQGFEDEVLNVLIKRYPPNLLADLQVCHRFSPDPRPLKP